MKKTGFILMTTALMMLLVSCEKVSPIGVLVSGTGVEDRIKMSHMYYSQHKDEYHMLIVDDLGDLEMTITDDEAEIMNLAYSPFIEESIGRKSGSRVNYGGDHSISINNPIFFFNAS